MKLPGESQQDNNFESKGMKILIALSVFITLLMAITVIWFIRYNHKPLARVDDHGVSPREDSLLWVLPDTAELGNSEKDQLIKYGRDLIAHTSLYLGPKGTVRQITNGMNCQNCHLHAGTKIFGNNYSAVASTYPRFRERSGTVENIYKRVNDCLERSLNGAALDTSSREMQAIRAYILWLGKNVKKGIKPKGVGITDLPFLDRAADVEKGKTVYLLKCQKCHASDGGGKLLPDGKSYQYPPLWGKHSYNTGAGLFRLSRIAGYVKSNMPYETNYDNPQLSDEEAWDVAAYVSSQPRPAKDLHRDWPRIAGKPVDHPFGPYADTFSERQHKFGPFGPIVLYRKKIEDQAKKSN